MKSSRLPLVLLLALAAPGALLGQGTPQAGHDEWATDFSKHTVPLDQIMPGGPPKDGIPALDAPRFVPVASADRWLEDREPVMVVEHDGDARAYPYQILIWHEIVNDAVGGRPLVVTYCPLCNTALAFDRRHDGRTLDFGTTGRLRHSDLVMYDRQTESWWQQATGEAIVGDFAGDTLDLYPAQSMSWADFRRAHPAGRVLSRDTGYERPYGRNPYQGYDQRSGPFRGLFDGDADRRLPAMERVAAVRLGGRAVAYPFSELSEQRVVHDEIDGTAVVVFWKPGTASALDAGTIPAGRDVGATGVFRRALDGRTLTFRAVDDDAFEDRQTGSRWNLAGQATSGPLEGTRLRRIPHGDYFWFAWAAFRPDTEIRR